MLQMTANGAKKMNQQTSPNPEAIGWPLRFKISAGPIFLIVGLAKLISAFGNAGFLDIMDPVFQISVRSLLLSVGIFEIILSSICIFHKNHLFALSLISWTATGFLAYRLALHYMDWRRPCRCMGNLTDALHISPMLVDLGMKCVLFYLITGSYLALIQTVRLKKQRV